MACKAAKTWSDSPPLRVQIALCSLGVLAKARPQRSSSSEPLAPKRKGKSRSSVADGKLTLKS